LGPGGGGLAALNQIRFLRFPILERVGLLEVGAYGTEVFGGISGNAARNAASQSRLSFGAIARNFSSL
jgi:hypothetical protein